jgi:hypothetical protein
MNWPFFCIWRAENVFTWTLNGFGQWSNKILLLRKKRKVFLRIRDTFFLSFWHIRLVIGNKCTIFSCRSQFSYQNNRINQFFPKLLFKFNYAGPKCPKCWTKLHFVGLNNSFMPRGIWIQFRKLYFLEEYFLTMSIPKNEYIVTGKSP